MQGSASSDRRIIQRALALSVLLHAVLLATGRTPPSWTTERDLPVDLRLWIDNPGDQELLHDEIVETRAAAANPRDVVARPEVPAVSGSGVLADPQPATALVAPEPPATAQSVAADEASEPQAPEPADSPTLASAASDGESVPVAVADESRLIRQVERWARRSHDAMTVGTGRHWLERGQRFEARVERRSVPDSMDFERLEVVVTVEQDGRELETRMQLRRLAFSHFTQLVDIWDDTMRLNDDAIYGRFHSNDVIQLGWTRQVQPRFFGQVSSASGTYKVVAATHARRRQEVFPGGIELNSAAIPLPRVAVPLGATAAEQALQRHFFDRDTDIEFRADGGFEARPHDDPAAPRHHAFGAQPVYLLARKGVTLRVRGRVRGQVLVYAPELLEITGDLTYARDVRRDPDAPDFVGLVSDREIAVADARITGPGDLDVEGALYARRAFTVRDIFAGYQARLNIYGSLSAGSMSATEPRYATRVEFDPRLEKLRPPGFPVTNRYEIDQWDRRWAPVPADSGG